MASAFNSADIAAKKQELGYPADNIKLGLHSSQPQIRGRHRGVQLVHR